MSLCKDDYLFFYLDCDRISTLVLKQNVDVLSQVTGAHLEVFWPGWQTVEKCHSGQNSGWFHHIFYSRYMESAPTTLDPRIRLFWHTAEILTAGSLPNSKNLLLLSIVFYLTLLIVFYLKVSFIWYYL
jgi:hypothetical protein